MESIADEWYEAIDIDNDDDHFALIFDGTWNGLDEE